MSTHRARMYVGLALIGCGGPAFEYRPLGPPSPFSYAMSPAQPPTACVPEACRIARSRDQAKALGIPEEAMVDFAEYALVRIELVPEHMPGATELSFASTAGPVIAYPIACRSPAGGRWLSARYLVVRVAATLTQIQLAPYDPCDPRLAGRTAKAQHE